MNLIRVFLGFAALFVYHLPRVLYKVLLVSYHAAFNSQDTLPGSPKDHLRRARGLLRTNRNSQLLYATLELRFALERMSDFELVIADGATRRMLDEHNPVKKISNLRRLDSEASFAQQIFLVNQATGERVKWGQYKPLDPRRTKEILGRLGDLLHPKRDLRLGLPDDPWYDETRRFLLEACDYLEEVSHANTLFFAFEGLDHVERVRVGGDEPERKSG